MKSPKEKTVKVMTGTDIVFCTPTHPYAVAVQIKRGLDRIYRSVDTEFEFNCNILAGIQVFEDYGRKKLLLNIQYYINGTKASYDAVVSDMKRGEEYVKLLNEEKE